MEIHERMAACFAASFKEYGEGAKRSAVDVFFWRLFSFVDVVPVMTCLSCKQNYLTEDKQRAPPLAGAGTGAHRFTRSA